MGLDWRGQIVIVHSARIFVVLGFYMELLAFLVTLEYIGRRDLHQKVFRQILAPISRRSYDPIEIWSCATGRELQLDTATVEASSFTMRIGDLKRAVEDVILRPDQNTLNDIDKRDTIAALDLCQPEPSPPLPTCTPSAASMNACSCSSETVPVDVPRPPPPLCTSTSLDTIVSI
ncbi:unnamed protein product [Strongylus vulgaris]|uniref:Uncharacterized protein n=1 Tax=Strongylus vulgaris TaxID=40348 RepID=A0A3P7IHH4_STRVU|nr:unnamed protein product [Strongylus vulgaris]